MGVLDRLAVPVVLAPLAGGPGTVELAAAVDHGGGFAFLPAGYLTADRLRSDVDRLRALGVERFGVNLFVPTEAADRSAAVEAHRRIVRPLAAEAGVVLGAPRADDDGYRDKMEALAVDPPAVVSTTFGLPSIEDLRALHAVGAEVWVTVTTADEARSAAALGADALVVQGVEAGGHQGGFVDHDGPRLHLADLLAAVRVAVDLPLVAAGGLVDGEDVRAVMALGAAAAQLGTAFLRCPEAGTSEVHRAAVASDGETVLTRTFSGRTARSIRNAWTNRATGVDLPTAYPEVHHLTAPVRAAGRAMGDHDLVNLWAGTAHRRARDLPAAAVVAEIGRALRGPAGPHEVGPAG